MCGSEITRGLSRKRSSASASGTTKTSDCKIAVEQKAMSREVSEASTPTRDLNHWRSSSTREMRAMGVLQTNEASRVRSSKDCSGSVSRMAYFSKAAILPSSLTGLAMTMSHLLHDPGLDPGRGGIILQNGEYGAPSESMPSDSVERHLPIEYAADLTPVVAAKEARASWNARGMAETA